VLEERLRRLRDLYELGDLSKPDYVPRRAALQEELAALAPTASPNIDLAGRVLDDFGVFWRVEDDPEAKRELLHLIFERVWLDERRIVAVRPKVAFAPFFLGRRHETAGKACLKSGSDGTRTRDLRRDGPSRARRRPTTNGSGRAHLQALFAPRLPPLRMVEPIV
jgi:hypothetical protein